MPDSAAFARLRLDTPGGRIVALGLAAALAVIPVVFVPALYDDFTLIKQSTLLVAAALVLVGLAWDGALFPLEAAWRWFLVAWAGWLTFAWAAGRDPLGGLTGVYQYRQGFLTQVAYGILFLGAFTLSRRTRIEPFVCASALFGLAVATAYTLIQAAGLDPFSWWLDTRDRAISTIGNANELAAYAVIAMAFASPLAGAKGVRSLLPAFVSAACWFIVLEAESRSGIAALLIVHLSVAALLAGARSRAEFGRHTLLLTGGAACGLILSVGLGGAQGSAERLDSVVQGQDPGGSTRISLFRGALPTIAASPLWGHGPDGLYLAFPQHRPAELGGAFETYDLTVQSSHNWVLDTAAGTGLIGLALFAGLLALAAWRPFREDLVARSPATVMPWAAMAAYGALTLVNPISLAAHVQFFVLLGMVAGRSLRQATSAPVPTSAGATRVGLGLALPAAVALVAVAVALPIADYAANDAWNHTARGEFAASATRYRRAELVAPFQRDYASRRATALLAAGAGGDEQALLSAESAFRRFDDRFGFASGEAVALATVLIGLERPAEEVIPVIDRAEQLNPHGVSMATYTDNLRAAATSGGILRYIPQDRWVLVEAVNR